MPVKILETYDALIYEGRWWGTESEKAKATENRDFVVVRFEYNENVWNGVVDFSKSASGDFDEADGLGGEALYADREPNLGVRAAVIEAARGHRARTGAVNLV